MDAFGKIDEIDAKILRDLLTDGRKELTQISIEAEVSEDIIWQHYTKMKKQGIIVGSTIQVDYEALGYAFFTQFFVSVELQKQNSAVTLLQKIPGVYPPLQCGCSSELWTIGTQKNMTELENVKQSIRRIPGVFGLRTVIVTGNRNNPENLSILQTEEKTEGAPETKIIKGRVNFENTANIDNLDLQLIGKLAIDSRASFNKVARELKISTDTVARRYNSLQKNGVIKPLIQVNPVKLGYPADAIISMTARSQDDLAETAEKIASIPDIVGLWKTIGSYDLAAWTKVKSIEQIIAIQNEITNLPEITKMETVMLNTFPVMPFPREHTSSF